MHAVQPILIFLFQILSNSLLFLFHLHCFSFFISIHFTSVCLSKTETFIFFSFLPKVLLIDFSPYVPVLLLTATTLLFQPQLLRVVFLWKYWFCPFGLFFTGLFLTLPYLKPLPNSIIYCLTFPYYLLIIFFFIQLKTLFYFLAIDFPLTYA